MPVSALYSRGKIKSGYDELLVEQKAPANRLLLVTQRVPRRLRQPFYANLQEVFVPANALPSSAILHLVHIPISPDKSAVQELGFTACGPYREMTW
jgi:hypothetical protein